MAMTFLDALSGWARIGVLIYLSFSLGLAIFVGCLSFQEQVWRWPWAEARERARWVVEALVIAFFSLVFWPILFPWVWVQDRFPAFLSRWLKPDPVAEPEAPEPEFSILPEHLGELVDVEVLEASQRINDPLRAVPDLPFGHLYARWLLLRIHLGSGRSLRRFSVPRRGPGRDHWIIHRGWAVVDTDSTIVSYWITEWERQDAVIPDQAVTTGQGVEP